MPAIIYLFVLSGFLTCWQLYLHLARPEGFSGLSTLFSSSMVLPHNECMWKKSIMAEQLNQRPSLETVELKAQYITDRDTEMWLHCVDSGESVASSGLCSRRQNGWWYMAMYTEDGPPLQAQANKKTLVKEKKSACKWCLIETVQEGSSSGQWLPGVHTHAGGGGGGAGSGRREVMID